MNTNLFLDALMTLFGLHIVQTYLASFRREAAYHKAFRYASWVVYTLFLYMVMFFNSSHPLFTLLGNIVLLAVLLFAYGCGDSKTALFRSCIFQASRMIVEVVTQSILLAALGKDSFVAGNIISTLAMYVIIQIYKHWKGRDLTVPLSFRQWIKLFLVPVSSMGITYYAHVIALPNGQMAFFYFLTVLIILINYLIFDLYDKMSAQTLLERQNHAYEQEILLCVRQAAKREEAYRQTRTLRHDLKGRLVALTALLEAEQTEEAKREITRMLQENSLNRHGIAETGNLALDALVNYKYAAADAEGIQMSCRLEVPAGLFVEGTDLCVILENLLNNAMEAVQKLPKEERSVSLAVQLIKGALFITVENPYQGEIIMDWQGNIQSSKTGEHGIGLLSVEKTAEKYGGEVTISHEDMTFQVTVMLCRQEILPEESQF
ncbi:MAG: GHKL domain-containing protein [Lachnospiraceae bacterium]|nr:GHKL domain-containing protein [Lachnospiraceae bacterium]